MNVPKQKPGCSKQNYATPYAFIEAVKRKLGIEAFTHDFAADSENTKADTWFDEGNDALSIPCWENYCHHGWGWLNPPFADISPWAERCVSCREGGGAIALLVPASVGSNWFRDFVDDDAFVLFLNGRLAFLPDKQKWLYPKDCILCLYSPYVQAGYEVWKWR